MAEGRQRRVQSYTRMLQRAAHVIPPAFALASAAKLSTQLALPKAAICLPVLPDLPTLTACNPLHTHP